MKGWGLVRMAVVCACVASAAALGACGEDERSDSRAAAAPAPLEHSHRGAANVLIVVDASEGMDGERMGKARAGLDSLVRALPAGDSVGLARFSSHFEPLVPVLAVRENRRQLLAAVSALEPGGDSAVYSATLQAYGIQRELAGGRGANTVIVLAHSEDSASTVPYTRVRRLLGARSHGPGVRVFTVAYDTDRDSGLREALAEVARASNGKAYTATPDDLGSVLRRAWSSL
jgi:uncharacterized protein (DUF58 family)